MKNKIIVFFIITITIIKLKLIGVGFFSFHDEHRYYSSVSVLVNISTGEYQQAIKNIFATSGRPGEVIVRTIPALFKVIIPKFTVPGNIPMFLFNFLIFCLILIVHFKFSKLFLKDTFLALISVSFFGCLTNAYIYIRHAFPYDISLLFFYYVIYKVSKLSSEGSISYKQSYILGLISFFGFSVYPGYYSLLFLIGGLLLFNNLTINPLNQKLKQLSFFILGNISCLLLFESLSIVGNMSYINESVKLSGTIIQGSFEESFSFLFKYLIQVEHIQGIIIMLGLLAFYFYILKIIVRGEKQYFQFEILVFSLLLISYLIYASLGFFFHKTVFYGRLLHQYMPFITIFCVFGINELVKAVKLKKELIFYFLIFIMFAGFITNIYRLTKIAYPNDVILNTKTNYPDRNIAYFFEYNDVWNKLDSNIKSESDLILVNAAIYYPLNETEKYKPYLAADEYNLLFSKPHYINFKAYQFEGFSIQERKNIKDFNLIIKLYSQK